MVVQIHPEGPNRKYMKKLEISHEDEMAIRSSFIGNGNLFDEYKTIGGNLAFVLTKNAGGPLPWVGVYYVSDQIGDVWVPCAWTDRGKVMSISKSAKPYYSIDLDILDEQPQFA